MSWQNIPGWCSYEYLYREAIDRMPAKGGRMLEIGSALGQSAACAGELIIASGKEIELWCVDCWLGAEGWPSVWLMGLEPVLDVSLVKDAANPFAAFVACLEAEAPQVLRAPWFHAVRAFSMDAARLVEGDFDFIFVDGDHRYDGALLDIKTWLPRVKAGGVLAGDDYLHEFQGVIRAVGESFGDDVRITAGPKGRHWWHEVKR